MKKIKRNILIGGPIEIGDENNPEYKVMKCQVCKKQIIMLKEDWDNTIKPEKLKKVCCFCIALFA
jgi:hypothetical protein